MEYEKAVKYSLQKYNLNWKRYLMLIAVVVLLIAAVGVAFNVLFRREMKKVSIATYSSPAALGDLFFLETTSLFPQIYLAIDLTPGKDGGEFIAAHIDSSDSYSFEGAVKSNDGTVIAIRTTIGNLALPEEKGGGLYPFTHAYDFKTRTLIHPLDDSHINSDGSEAVWDGRAEKILQLLQERGGQVPFIENRRQLDYERLSYSKSKRWLDMINAYHNQE
ncbi:MAG: hypothetical protein K9M75_07860 [Phycisphaerae bacterium]|nr:hypothetical protein [Phycisphaerae bacterium]